MRWLWLVLVVVLGCVDPVAEARFQEEQRAAQRVRYRRVEQQKRDELAGQLIYFRDERTGLCFAAIDGRGAHGHLGLTWLPCLPSVVKRIPPNRHQKR